MPPKTGPNDRCPCGSGKKYKRCCMEADRAADAETAPADAGRSPDLKLLRLTKALGRGDMKALAESLANLTPLLEAGGPLESIRFDPAKFDAALVLALEHSTEMDDEAKLQQALKACVRDACDAREAESLVRRMTEIVQAGQLPPDAAGALSFWLASTEAALEGGGDVFKESPLLLAVAGVQAAEAAGARHRAVARIQTLAAGLADRSLSLSDVSRELEEHGDEVATLMESVPGLAELAESTIAKAQASLPRLLRGRKGLQVLGLEEYLLLTWEVSRLMEEHADRDVLSRRLGDHLRDHPLGDVVCARLRLASKAPGLSRAKRDRFTEALVLREMDPAGFLMAALKERSVEASAGEIACLEGSGSRGDGIEALAAHYESLGLVERAATARKAAEIARSLPPSPPAG